jgi:hypothetical protein
MKKAQPTIEEIKVDDLIPYATNSRTHSTEQVAQIAASMVEFGWTNPVLIDANATIVAGHGRIMAARQLGMDTIPCIRLGHLSPAQVRAYVIADNKLALNAGWDEAMLKAELDILKEDGFDIGLTGFFEEELNALLNSEIIEGQTDLDEMPEPPVEPVTKLGDIWVLGNHRLMCGDSIRSKDFGSHCPTLFFDPPWDAGVSMPKRENTLAFCDGQRAFDIVNLFGPPTWMFAWDCVSSWYTPNRPLKRMKVCLWYGDVKKYNPEGAHYGDAGEQRTVSNTRGSYEFVPDPRGKHLSDVFSMPITKLHSEEEHQHSKPIDWVRMLIANCSTGEVFDPFMGSGTSMIACEQLGRTCYGVELDPKYCDVIVKRWEDFTGKKAALESALC